MTQVHTIRNDSGTHNTQWLGYTIRNDSGTHNTQRLRYTQYAM